MRLRVLGGMLLVAASVTFFCVRAWSRGDDANERVSIVLDEQSGTIELRGLRDPQAIAAQDWAALLTVHPSSAAPDLPAMQGEYEVTGGRVRFRPQFPFVPGLPYRARFDRAALHLRTEGTSSAVPPLEATLLIPSVRRPPSTTVTAVYPGGDELPANQLKFYVSFSAPMAVGEARERVHLLDDDGREVPRAFLWLEEELWDRSRQRLTLILDPGRIKRGLRSNEEDGAPLRPGGRYRLVVDHSWPDGDGSPLRESFSKGFRVVQPDRRSPDPAAWRLSSPKAGTTEPITLRFDEPLDYALLHEMIAIRDDSGTSIEGTVRIAGEEREWRFEPARPWQPSRHSVHVRREVEDRSGNDLERLFDADLSRPARDVDDWIELAFEPGD